MDRLLVPCFVFITHHSLLTTSSNIGQAKVIELFFMNKNKNIASQNNLEKYLINNLY